MYNPYKESLIVLENGLWDHDLRVEEQHASPYEYDDETFRACIKLFMSSMMWKLWEVQEKNDVEFSIRCDEAESVGNEIKEFVKKWTDIDTRSLYK